MYIDFTSRENYIRTTDQERIKNVQILLQNMHKVQTHVALLYNKKVNVVKPVNYHVNILGQNNELRK